VGVQRPMFVTTLMHCTPIPTFPLKGGRSGGCRLPGRSRFSWARRSQRDTGEVIEGRLPPRVLGLVQEWREYHKTELTEDWNLARERRALKRIDPLE